LAPEAHQDGRGATADDQGRDTVADGPAADDPAGVAASFTAAHNGLRQDGDHDLDLDVHAPDQACEP
jgi:hypothetical protein